MLMRTRILAQFILNGKSKGKFGLNFRRSVCLSTPEQVGKTGQIHPAETQEDINDAERKSHTHHLANHPRKIPNGSQYGGGRSPAYGRHINVIHHIHQVIHHNATQGNTTRPFWQGFCYGNCAGPDESQLRILLFTSAP